MSATQALPIRVPDDFVLWVASDLHGMADATRLALARAGFIDGAWNWTAPPRTALVILGDVIDRGPASADLFRRLRDLERPAATAGSLVATIEGNHEWNARVALAGSRDGMDVWLENGGATTVSSFGLAAEADSLRADPPAFAAAVEAAAPDFGQWLASLPPYGTWRDVLLAHAGAGPWAPSLAAYAAGTDRLLLRGEFFDGPSFPDHAAWETYAAAGIRRAVVGHTPQAVPTTFHGGAVLVVDTNACGIAPAPHPTRPAVSLVRVPPSGSLEGAHVEAFATA